MRKLLLFSVVGLLAQLVDGSLGMAYGVTATSALVASGATVALASAAVHLAEVGTTAVSGFSHWRFGNVNWRTVAWLGVPGAVGAFLGATVLSSFSSKGLSIAVSFFLLALGVYVLSRFAFGFVRTAAPEEHARGGWLAGLGLGAGFLDAIGGGGWGPVTSPTLMTIGRHEPRTAIGSVSASEFLVSVAASLGFLTNLGSEGIDTRIVAGLLLGGLVAAPLAAWLVRHLDPHITGTLAGCLIIVTNSRTLMLRFGVPGPIRLAVLLTLGAATLGMLLWQLRRVGEAWKPRSTTSAAAAASAATPDPALAGPAPTADVVPEPVG